MARKKAFVSGVTGMDGSHLCELLLEKDYEVWGLIRSNAETRQRLPFFSHDPRFHAVHGDITDPEAMAFIFGYCEFDEVYALGAQSQVGMSFNMPHLTFETDATAVLRLLQLSRTQAARTGKKLKFYQASSSEMWGVAPAPQDEQTPFNPISPYAIAKLAAHHFVRLYRNQGMFACAGILCNHESPRRGERFVTQKIARGAAAIKLGLAKELHLGNLDAKRDWGYAPDYVRGMWMMLQHDVPDDYVLATGESHSVEEFVALAFGLLDLDYQNHIVQDKALMRPVDIPELRGDATKARETLGWRPTLNFHELVELLVSAAYNDLKANPGKARLDV